MTARMIRRNKVAATADSRREATTSNNRWMLRAVVWLGLMALTVFQLLRDGPLASSLYQQLYEGGAMNPTTTTKLSYNDRMVQSHNVYERITHFLQTAGSLTPVTDKVGSTSERHTYQNMYGLFLMEKYAFKPNMKMLEIGLGCDMKYGPGASVSLWRSLFPRAELWEAEYDGECVEKAIANGQLNNIHTLVGDQSNPIVLDSWIAKSGGHFDVIMDDGGHKNCHIRNSFDKLWPTLNPGGYYFVEDLHVGHSQHYTQSMHGCDNGKIAFSKIVAEWQEQLIYKRDWKLATHSWNHTIPDDMLFVHCQEEACVFGKRQGEANGPWMDVKNVTTFNLTENQITV